MNAAGLFDREPYATGPEPDEWMSADRKRTARQHAAAAAGVHPLALAITGVYVHPDATAAGLTCGQCTWRSPNERGYPKCWMGDGVRASHGAGTDIRAWWPACTDYDQGDPTVGPDAMRVRP